MKKYTNKKLVNTKTGYEYKIFKDNVGEGVIVNGMFTYLSILGIKNGEDKYHVYAVVNDR